MHGACRISTLLSSFRDVILLLAIVGRCKQGRWLLSLPHSVPSPRNDFKVVAENRFANPWRRRIEPLSYSSTSISLRIVPARPRLFLSLVIYNGFSLFFSKVRKFCWLPKLVATLLFNYTRSKRFVKSSPGANLRIESDNITNSRKHDNYQFQILAAIR